MYKGFRCDQLLGSLRIFVVVTVSSLVSAKAGDTTSDATYSQLLNVYYNSFQDINASWVVDQTFSPCADSDTILQTQKKALAEGVASGKISKKDYEANLATAQLIADKKVFTDQFRIDLTLINSSMFKIKQTFLGNGDVYNYYAGGNGLCLTVSDQKKFITIVRQPDKTLGTLLRGMPINVIQQLLKVGSISFEQISDSPQSLQLGFKSEGSEIKLILLKPHLIISLLEITIEGKTATRISTDGEVSCGQVFLPKIVKFESFCKSGASNMKQTWTLQQSSIIANPAAIDTGYSFTKGYNINDWTTKELRTYKSNDILLPGK